MHATQRAQARVLGLRCRYKAEIRAEDKTALHRLLRRQYHYLVTPEVHRELEAPRREGPLMPAVPAHLASLCARWHLLLQNWGMDSHCGEGWAPFVFGTHSRRDMQGSPPAQAQHHVPLLASVCAVLTSLLNGHPSRHSRSHAARLVAVVSRLCNHGVALRSRGEKGGKAGALEAQARISSKVMENIRELPPVLLMDED